MAQRHKDAIAIQQGACNPHGITRSLLRALDECRAENPDTDYSCKDPAIRLIVHQLAFICGVPEIEHGGDPLVYVRLHDECEVKAKEPIPTSEPSAITPDLVHAACLAEEEFGPDELERYAAELRKGAEGPTSARPAGEVLQEILGLECNPFE